jgi:uncharacterized membrane protein
MTAGPAAGIRKSLLRPTIRRIGVSDVVDAVKEGFEDFKANPTHLIILCLVYPIAGLLFGRIADGSNALPLVWPLVAGFALIGPIAAVGLYEMSHRRELGQPVALRNAFDVFASPRFGAIFLLGVALIADFVVWLVAAKVIYGATMPTNADTSIGGFIDTVLYTSGGHHLMVIGTIVGFVFALGVLILGVFSIPLLVDREIGTTPGEQALIAVETSIRAVVRNPVAVAAWGIVVVAGLALGIVTLLVGFAVVMPVLGHATWHLYRRVIAIGG